MEQYIWEYVIQEVIYKSKRCKQPFAYKCWLVNKQCSYIISREELESYMKSKFFNTVVYPNPNGKMFVYYLDEIVKKIGTVPGWVGSRFGISEKARELMYQYTDEILGR